MDNQIEEIKRKVDIVALIGEYVSLKKAGRNYKALCPFHAEKTPSFVVSADRQIFKCFGCGEGGDVFAFVKRADGVEFGEAIRKLAARAGVQLKEYKPSGIEKRRELIFSINKLAAELYNFLLTKHEVGKAALGYLHARKISDPSIKKFQLGFAPERQDLATRFFFKKGFSKEDLGAAGVSVSGDGNKNFDRFKGRVMFPIKDSQGRVVAFSGRALGSREPKYLNSPDSIVFNKSNSLYGIDLAKGEISRQKTAILVEGNLDVISSHQVGVTNTVAPLGTALTEKQLTILRRTADKLLFGFDVDIAGGSAAKRGIELAEEAGFSVKVIELGEDKDPDLLIRKNPTVWKERIKKAVPVYDFVISVAARQSNLTEAEGKRQISKEVLPFIAKIADEISRDHYIQKIAALLDVSEEAVRADLKKYLPRTAVTTAGYTEQAVVEQTPAAKSSRIDILEKYLLVLVLQTGVLPAELSEEFFYKEETKSLFKLIKNQVKSEGRLKLKTFSNQVPESLLPLYDESILYDLGEEIEGSPESSEKEISSCMSRIKELNLRTKLRKLGLEIKQAEAVSQETKIQNLTKQFRDLSLQLTQLKSESR